LATVPLAPLLTVGTVAGVANRISIGTNVDIGTDILVCAYTPAGGVGDAVTEKVFEAAPAVCTLGHKCSIFMPGTTQVSNLKFVYYTAVTDLTQRTLAEVTTDCNTLTAYTWEDQVPTGSLSGVSYSGFPANDCSQNFSSGCTFGTYDHEIQYNNGPGWLPRFVSGIFGMCANSPRLDVTDGSYVVAGILNMLGPDRTQTINVERGQPLDVVLQGLWANSLLPSRVMVAQGSCYGTFVDPLPVFGFPSELNFTGLQTVYGVSQECAAGDEPGAFQYTSPILGVQPGYYKLCWCHEDLSPRCITENEFMVETGSILLYGPFSPISEHICWRGVGCTITEFGLNFDDTDVLHICETTSYWSTYTDNPVNSSLVNNLGVQSKSGSPISSLAAYVRAPIVADPGSYEICWTSLDGASRTSAGAELALFKLLGPITSGSIFFCQLGNPCLVTVAIRDSRTGATASSLDSLAKSLLGVD
jgi:hypothetical protein